MSLGFSILAIPLPLSYVRVQSRVAESRIVSAGYEEAPLKDVRPSLQSCRQAMQAMSRLFLTMRKFLSHCNKN
jgi:hypothetical protein